MDYTPSSREEQLSVLPGYHNVMFPSPGLGHSVHGAYLTEPSYREYNHQQMYSYQNFNTFNYSPQPTYSPATTGYPYMSLPCETAPSLPSFQVLRQEYHPPAVVTSKPDTSSLKTPTSSANSPLNSSGKLAPTPSVATSLMSSPRSRRSSYSSSSGNSTDRDSGSDRSRKSAQPGPVPASPHIDIYFDQAGVQHVWFKYSSDRHLEEFDIRCDAETVDVKDLSMDFKVHNCVYPRAMLADAKSNRLPYETQCNQIGWQLAQLNPILRARRGLIQRAVDTWRNSHKNPKYHSRRAKRQLSKRTRQPKKEKLKAHDTMMSVPPSPQTSIHGYSQYDLDGEAITPPPYRYITMPTMMDGIIDSIRYDL